MATTLIIKTGAAGDVVRSTVLLHALKGDVYWITAKHNMPLFPDSLPLLKELASIDQVPPHFFELEFDEIINLEEDVSTAQLAQRFKAVKRTGIYIHEGKLLYSPGSAPWYDTSLVSVYGKERANELKYANTKSYQEHLYEMIGKEFRGENYLLYGNETRAEPTRPVKIGIEKRAGGVWPNKQWWGYDQLGEILEKRGYEIFFFHERASLREYLQDIKQCELFISGDTLGMHVALGYNIPTIAIFNCTSPQEIYSYGLLSKVISPLLHEVYYQTGFRSEVVNSVRIEEVLNKVEEWEKTSGNHEDR